MILDQLSAATAYEGLHPLFPKAFAYLRGFNPNTEDGKHEIQGQDLVAIVQRYQTAPADDKTWEAHKIYGDIQFVYEGIEFCGHTDQSTLTVTKPYFADKDVEKYAPPTYPTALITLGRGNFAVFYPRDGHQPGVQVTSASEILKVVVKFRL